MTSSRGSAFVAEAISLRVMVAGMFPTMYWLIGMSHEGTASDRLGPDDPSWWAAMSVALIVGSLVTYPASGLTRSPRPG
jgi:hypothetical protein